MSRKVDQLSLTEAVWTGLTGTRHPADIHAIQACFQTSASGAQTKPAVLDYSSETKSNMNT